MMKHFETMTFEFAPGYLTTVLVGGNEVDGVEYRGLTRVVAKTLLPSGETVEHIFGINSAEIARNARVIEAYVRKFVMPVIRGEV